MKSFQILPLAVACALGLPFHALAQSATPDVDATQLDEVIVTATRTEIALADSIVPAQVIDRDEIERSQARSLPELLRGRAGINLANQGGAGKLTTVSIRGTEGDHVLVLVDGIRIGSATAGLASFQDLPVEQIERIEIVRGSRSSLYGSEAIGGVIQIFTRRDQGKPVPRFRVGAGSHGLREASAGIGGKVGRGWFGVDAAYQRTDGINACRGAGFPVFAGCFTDEPDRDGYRNASINVRGGVALGEHLQLEGTALRADARNEFDGGSFSGNEAENAQQAAGAKLVFTPSQRFKLTTQAGRAYDRSENYFVDSAAGTRLRVGEFDTRRDTASAQGDITVMAGQVLTVGADWQRDAIESDVLFDVTERDNFAGFVAYQGEFGAHRLEASLRNDDNEQFGAHGTGSAGWGMGFGSGFRVNASYATGFKAPSFNDLYFPFFGNPDLEPEHSRGINAGINQVATHWNWTFNVYQTRIDDLIAFDAALLLPNNIEQARIRGAEFTFATVLANWDVSAQLSHTDPRNRTPGANHGNLLPRRSRNTARIDLDRAFGKLRFGTTFLAASHRYDNVANSVRLGGHATLDLRVSYAFHQDWTLQALASNVFDRDYETVAWYNQPGREYGLSLRYAPRK